MHFDLFDPIFDILETLPFVYGVSEDYPHGSSVVSLRNSLKLLLPRCIPNLQPDFVLADSDGLDLEVNADCGEMRCHEVVLAELQQHVGLTDSTVANHQQFNEVIIVLILLHSKHLTKFIIFEYKAMKLIYDSGSSCKNGAEVLEQGRK
jgi:hypothetical protein